MNTPDQKSISFAVEDFGGHVIERGEDITMPTDLDFSALEGLGVKQKLFESVIKQAFQYLRFPILTDRFENDHDARRVWKQQMRGKPDIAMLQSTKLAGKQFLSLLMSANFIAKTLQEHSAMDDDQRLIAFQKLDDDYRESFSYDKKSLEEKIAFARQLTSHLHEFLNALIPSINARKLQKPIAA